MSHLSCLNLNKSTVGFDLFQCSPRNKCFACWERIAHAKIEARAKIKRGGEGRGGGLALAPIFARARSENSRSTVSQASFNEVCLSSFA